MGIIKKLATQDILKIAAGEVVERPWNIVKELVENALDAHATHITVRVAGGGIASIGVADNGCGMVAQDALACFEHHATSKIATCDDVTYVRTFGFRGEALSSIAAISNVTLVTQYTGAVSGTRITIEAGHPPSVQVCAAAPGTELVIQDIFSSIPARKKFLKSPAVEWRACWQFLQAIACARPDVGFTIYHDEQLLLTVPAGQTLEQRWAHIVGGSVASHCLAIEEVRGHLSIQGFVSDPQTHRYDRSGLYLLVNGRWIKNQKLISACLRAYKGILPAERYPVGVLAITLPPDQVDVNVHPRKEEVAFAQAREVESLVYTSVSRVLQDRAGMLLTALRPATTSGWNNHAQYVVPSMVHEIIPHARHSSTGATAGSESREQLVSRDRGSDYVTSPTVVPEQESQKALILSLSKGEPHADIELPRIMGQLLTTYIVSQVPTGLLIIDQHAAHEAILYERFKHLHQPTSVPLIFPEVLSLSSDDITLLLECAHVWEQQGIVLEHAGEHALHITHTPVHLTMVAISELLKQALVWLREEAGAVSQRFSDGLIHKWYALLACKAAVKAGDTLSTEQMEQIVKDLYATRERLTCPHGRPTLWHTSQTDIERMFKRRA